MQHVTQEPTAKTEGGTEKRKAVVVFVIDEYAVGPDVELPPEQVVDIRAELTQAIEALRTGAGEPRAATREGCQHHKSVCDEGKVPEEMMRQRAYERLQGVAEKFGLGFNDKELSALYHLSQAFDPALAIDVAKAACRRYVERGAV